MNFLEEARGFRTLLAGLVGMLCLVIGLTLLTADQRGAAYVFFSAGIGAIVSALVVKSVGESAAGGDGFKGIARNLMTSSKPGDPPPPPVTP
jgi:uncharacterized membrane protein YeaQ/YmgE (transglycosylase-associated protein family)